MFFGILHPRIFIRVLGATAFAFACAIARAAACGVASGVAIAEAATERGEIRLRDGRIVRLAGLDISSPADARAALERDWVGKSVVIDMLAPRPDRWGRWLADLSTVDDDSAAFDLLTAGIARVRPEFETRDCEAERLDAESAARAAKQGVWNEPDAILNARDRVGLAVNDGRFVIVEGVVRGVGLRRSRAYLDFGRRDGFTVVIANKMESALARRGLAPRGLAGRAIRVRGVLEMSFGSRIELADPQMIEAAEGTKSGG